ncbi:ATP-binding protein [Ferrimonas futtsuensis]|uniref:ATP-binding protein n=1 Tax=Ferrimonas futtsuensis TaxID=364764 RepID=UPI0003FBA66E|nr:ATP-binding protein [Ferrimonas futtsuensis]
MSKLIPPLFTRIYVGMVLALVGSVFLTSSFSDSWYEETEVKDFYADTFAMVTFFRKSWQMQSISAEEYIGAIDLSMSPWDTRWIDGVNTPPCDDCKLMASFDDSEVYQLEEFRYLATFPIPEQGGVLVMYDKDFAVFEKDLRGILEQDPEAAGSQLLYDSEFRDLDEGLLTIVEEDPDVASTLLLFGLMLSAFGAVIYLPARQLQRQIRRLSHTQAKFGQGQLNARADVPRSEPVRQLSSGFNKMADAISRSVEESRVLAQAVPHELRTPLSRIQLANGLLRKQCDKPEQVALLDDIDNYIEDMDQLTHQVLTLFRLNSPDKGSCSQQPDVELAEILDQRLKWFQQTGSLPVRAYIPNLPALGVNPTCFRLLLDNLMSNAQRYGHSQVRLSAETTAQGTQVHVEEDGEGIPETDRELIFIPFSRLDSSRTQATGGLGLGLAIAQAAAHRMGAQLSVSDSELGGARFTIVFKEQTGA